MAAEAAQRERRLWLALGASAVMHCVTLLLVVAVLAGQGRAPLPAGGAADVLGRRSGRSLLQAADLLSRLRVGEKGDLIFDVPVTFEKTVDVNAMFYANWLKVDTLARIHHLMVEDNIKTNTAEVVNAFKVGGKVEAEDLTVSGTAAIGTNYRANSEMAGVVMNVFGTALMGAEGKYSTEVAPGKVTTAWPGKDCAVGRSYADVAAGLSAAPRRICT